MRGWKRLHSIIPVMKRRLGSGTTKQVSASFPITGTLQERVVAIAKLAKAKGESRAASVEKIASLRKEVWLTELFCQREVPHILRVREVVRSDGEVGAMMPFCGLGDLFDLSSRIYYSPIPD